MPTSYYTVLPQQYQARSIPFWPAVPGPLLLLRRQRARVKLGYVVRSQLQPVLLASLSLDLTCASTGGRGSISTA
jgi:hypothetical protein